MDTDAIETAPRAPAVAASAGARAVAPGGVVAPPRDAVASQADAGWVLFRRATLVAIGIAAVAVSYEIAGDTELVGVLPLLALVILSQAFPVFWSRSPDIFSPLGFNGLLGGLGLLASYTSIAISGRVEFPLVPWLDGPGRVALAQTIFVGFLVGNAAYYAGYFAPIGPRFARFFPSIHELEWNRGRLMIFSAVCFIASLAAYAYFQSKLDVPIWDVSAIAAGKRVWREDPTLSWLHRGTNLAFLPIFLYFGQSLTSRRPLTVVLNVLGLAVVGLLITRLGQRGPAAYAAIAMLIMFHYLRRRLPATLLVVLWFVGLLAMNALGELRKESSDAPPPAAVAAAGPAASLAAHEDDRQRLSGLAVIFHSFPDRQEYLLGESWTGLVAVLIPRWVWPTKGDHFQWRDTTIIPRLVGAPIPTPFLGVLYANFSWLGIVFGMMAWGAFHRALYEWVRRYDRNHSVVLMYSLILIHFGPTLLQISAAVQFVLPMYVIIRLIGTRAHVPGAPPAAARAA